VFQFAQKELAPKAAEIDRENTFKEMRVSDLSFCCNVPQIQHIVLVFFVSETFHFLIAVIYLKCGNT